MTQPAEVTPAEDQEPVAQDRSAEAIKSIEARMAGLSRGSDTEEPATEPVDTGAEGETAEEAVETGTEEVTPYTLAEIRAAVADDPKWFDRLDKEGWSRIPEEVAAIYKTVQGDFTRTVQRIKESAKPQSETPRQEEPKRVTAKELAKEIFEDEAIDVLEMLLDEKLNAVLPPEKRERQQREEALNDGFSAAATQAPYLNEPAVMDELTEVIAADELLQEAIHCGVAEIVAKAFVTAGKLAKANAAHKAAQQKTQKDDAKVRAQAEARKEKLRVNATAGTAPLSATAGVKGSVDGESRYDKLVNRYNTAVAKQR
jgi:hypothetical protein